MKREREAERERERERERATPEAILLSPHIIALDVELRDTSSSSPLKFGESAGLTPLG